MHVVYPAVVSALLFSIGVYGVLARRNTILVLMSVELMLNAVNLNLVAFDVWLRDRLHSGQVLTLFVIVIAAAEVGVGLAIVLALYRNRRTVDLDHLRDLAEPPKPSSAADPHTSATTTGTPLGWSASPAGSAAGTPPAGSGEAASSVGSGDAPPSVGSGEAAPAAGPGDAAPPAGTEQAAKRGGEG